MFDALRRRLLRLLRVPPEPDALADARTLRIFRAAPRYFHYRVVLWVAKQLSALVGLVLGLVLAGSFAAPFFERWLGGWGVLLLAAAEGLAVATFLLQLPLGWMILRLDWEMRWYILTDRSLRVRDGVVHLREKTMTFANIQHVGIRQNPLQRLLGIADVEVRTAGGGSGEGGKDSLGESRHEAYFRGVDDAEHIRGAIRERARLHRDGGLGDPELRPAARSPVPAVSPQPGAAPAALPPGGVAAALAAALEVRDEVRALRGGLLRRG